MLAVAVVFPWSEVVMQSDSAVMWDGAAAVVAAATAIVVTSDATTAVAAASAALASTAVDEDGQEGKIAAGYPEAQQLDVAGWCSKKYSQSYHRVNFVAGGPN